MADTTSELMQGLLDQIKGFERERRAVEVGYVDEVGDGIARVTGLEGVRSRNWCSSRAAYWASPSTSKMITSA